MDNLKTPLLKALIKMTGLTSTELASQCGMAKSNFSAALNTDRPFPKDKLERLLTTLGLNDWKLTSSKVHFWSVASDIEPLKIAIKNLFPVGAQIEGVWREGSSPWDLNRVFDNVTFAITDGVNRVVIKRTGVSLILHLNPEEITPSTIPNLTWRTDIHNHSTMISLSNSEFEKWIAGNLSVEEFDKHWNQNLIKEEIEWDDIIKFAKSKNWTPYQTIGILKSSFENESTNET